MLIRLEIKNQLEHIKIMSDTAQAKTLRLLLPERNRNLNISTAIPHLFRISVTKSVDRNVLRELRVNDVNPI